MEENNNGALVTTPTPIFTEQDIQNIRAFKLMNGEDLIASFQAHNDEIYVLKRPCKVIRIANTDGTVAVVLVKWHVFSSEETYNVTKSSIVSFAKIADEMVEFYTKTVGKQVLDEQKKETTIPVEDAQGFQWPDWMDEAIAKKDKVRLN